MKGMASGVSAEVVGAMRSFGRFYTKRLGLFGRGYLGSGYNLAEARIIYEIGARGPMTAAQITRELRLDPAYLSRLLKRLRDDGLFSAEPDPSDQRSQILFPTDKGRNEYGRLGKLSDDQLAGLLAPLSAGEQEAIGRAVSTIHRLLDPERKSGAVMLRPHRPGDFGWLIMAQAEYYTRVHGWNDRFEALVCEVSANFLKNFDPSREYCWIAERDGERIGSVLVADGGNGIAKLRLLYVAEAARGLGLGRSLVGQCIDFARRTGYRELTLWTNDVLHPAIAIYRKAGFRLVAEEAHNQFGRAENGQTWTLSLSAAGGVS